MAKKRQELDPKTEKPKQKSDLTKTYMLGYIKEHGTDEDKAWFKELVRNNKVMKKSALDGKEYPQLDLAPTRQAYCERFFPNLLKTDWFDEVEKL